MKLPFAVVRRRFHHRPDRDRGDGLLTVSTLSFGVFYCFLVIAHDRRRALRCDVTTACG